MTGVSRGRLPSARPSPPHLFARPLTRQDNGSAALEFLGVLPILLLVALAGIQLGLVAYTASQAGTAVRAAAREAAKYQADVSGMQAGQDAVSDWLSARIQVVQHGGSVTATADIRIPSVLPGFSPGTIERSATMPRESEQEVGTP